MILGFMVWPRLPERFLRCPPAAGDLWLAVGRFGAESFSAGGGS